MNSQIWLVGIVAWCCTACGPVDLLGLDIHRPSDSRAYIEACVRGQDDVYCKAMLPTLSNVPGTVTVLAPNEGDIELPPSRQTWNARAST